MPGEILEVSIKLLHRNAENLNDCEPSTSVYPLVFSGRQRALQMHSKS